jgi:hypothetical protein
MQEVKTGGMTRFVGGTCPMTNPLPLLFLLLLQVFIGEVGVRQCAAHYLMLPGRRSVVPPKLQDLDSRALLVQRGQSATYYSGSGQLCVHAQPCLSVQLCIQGLGDAACSSAGVLILV